MDTVVVGQGVILDELLSYQVETRRRADAMCKWGLYPLPWWEGFKAALDVVGAAAQEMAGEMAVYSFRKVASDAPGLAPAASGAGHGGHDVTSVNGGEEGGV